jgi:anion-transporting  ArsA/GET3 family ATPase
VVATPEPDALREASYFVERLSQDRMPLAGLILNRVHRSQARLSAARSMAAAEVLQPAGVSGQMNMGRDGSPAAGTDAIRYPLAVAALRLHAERMQLIASERRLAQRFTAAHPGVPVAQVTAQPEDVHDLVGLRAIGEILCAD